MLENRTNIFGTVFVWMSFVSPLLIYVQVLECVRYA